VSNPPIGLTALGERLRHDLEILQYPPSEWVIPHLNGNGNGDRVTDVVVIGAGMCGLAAGFALYRAGISNIRILDASEAGREGPWVTYARMETLRSPKHLAGPAMGVASLSFRAWYEARWGVDAWEDLGKIPTAMWMGYLIWYREVLGLPVENDRQVVAIDPAEHGFDLRVSGASGVETIAARRVVLATGREGMALPRVPPPLRDFVGPRCRHSSEAIDFAGMAGQSVAVIGFSASAIDNAAEALEAGAAEVHLVVRSPSVPRVNKMKSTGYPGFTYGFPALPAEARLDLLSYVFRFRVAPPRDSVRRVWRHPKVRLHLDAEVLDARWSGEQISLVAGDKTVIVDHVILGTGFHIDVTAPPETRRLTDQIRTFRDTVTNSPGIYLEEFLDFPDLGPAFEFQERTPSSAPYLGHLHNFTFAATVSHGNVSGDIPCVSEGADRLARGIAAGFFNEDFPMYLANLHAHEDPELFGDEIPGNDAWSPPLDPRYP
jgi:cation diffusion facilitator CzcD-associated flavoprotein CzcO